MPDDGGGGGGGPLPPITFGGGGGGGGGIEFEEDILPGVDGGKPFPPLLLNGPAAEKPPFFPGLGPLLPNISADLAPTILTLVPERIPWKIKGGYWLKIFSKQNSFHFSAFCALVPKFLPGLRSSSSSGSASGASAPSR